MNAQRKMTPKGQMSSSGMGPAIHHLPMHIRALFEANGPLTHLPQLTKRKMPPYAGISDFISQVCCALLPFRTGNKTGRTDYVLV